MKTYSGLESLEINVPKKYYDFKENAYFRVFSDKNNPDAFDANFAVLKSTDDIAESVKQTEIFHEAAGAVPLFAYAPDSIPEEEAKAALKPLGYVFCTEELTVMSAQPKASYKDIMPFNCDVRIFTKLEDEERNFIIEQCGGEEYNALVLDKKLPAGAKLFVAYNYDKEPVSNCVCESYGEALYVCNVFTRENSRRRGFARAVMCAAMQYAYEKSYAAVYLHTSNDNARVLYEKLGFSVQGSISSWKAFKGELPEWIHKNVRVKI